MNDGIPAELAAESASSARVECQMIDTEESATVEVDIDQVVRQGRLTVEIDELAAGRRFDLAILLVVDAIDLRQIRTILQRLNELGEGLFAFTRHDDVDIAVGERLVGHQAGVDSSPDNRYIRVPLFEGLRGLQRSEDLWTGHGGDPQTDRFGLQSLAELRFPVWIGELIDDLDLVAQTIQWCGWGDQTQWQLDASVRLKATTWSRIEEKDVHEPPVRLSLPTHVGSKASNSAGIPRWVGER